MRKVRRARAADITIRAPEDGNLPAIITIQGQIFNTDNVKFLDAINGICHALVYLESPGGGIAGAIEIGITIRERRFDTAVPYRATCVSACALIWLGGPHRRLGDGAIIGFDSSWDRNWQKPSPMGNAGIVRYLDLLGLRVAAEYVTGTPPTTMTVLTREKAAMRSIAIPKCARNTSTRTRSSCLN